MTRNRLAAQGLLIAITLFALAAPGSAQPLSGHPRQAATPGPGQTISPEAMEEIARRTGLSREEITRRLVEADSTREPLPDSTADNIPGRSSLPQQPPAGSPIRPERTTEPPPGPPEFFGQGFFVRQEGLTTPSAFGPVSDAYQVGLGDEIVVDVWGDVEFRVERVVDRDGTILLPKGGKVRCAGRTLAEIKETVRDRLARYYSGLSLDPDEGASHLDVSLGKLRMIRVYVAGEAVAPGAYDLGSLSTMFTAVIAAGGPTPLGSMREIRLIRGNQIVSRLDFYGYLMEGTTSGDQPLREFDTIFIPPRGRSVSIVGAVRRPMTYELKPGESGSELVRFAGGFTAEAATEILRVQRILPPEQRAPGAADRVQVDLHLDSPRPAELLDGDEVLVDAISERATNWVEITGAVKRPGRFEHTPGLDMATLLERAGRAWPDVLDQRVLIDRVLPDGTWDSFNVSIEDTAAARRTILHPQDRIRVFSKWDITDRAEVTIDGEVRRPGSFEFRENLTVRDLVLKAEGFTINADVLQGEIHRLLPETRRSGRAEPDSLVQVIRFPIGADFLTRETGMLLHARDQVIIRRLPWWETQQNVSLLGEAVYPGVYPLLRPDERLSEVIARASGLKREAYPAGATMIRQDGVGPVAIDLDCALEDPGSSCDIQLRAGDVISIPRVPNTVKVSGAVGSPTSLIYKKGEGADYYISHAGGFLKNADRGGSRIVYPNGASVKALGFWSDPKVLAGSEILVPWKPESKGDNATLENVVRLSAIIASLATTYLVIDRSAD